MHTQMYVSLLCYSECSVQFSGKPWFGMTGIVTASPEGTIRSKLIFNSLPFQPAAMLRLVWSVDLFLFVHR